ncbi:MAG: hypothetical protein AB1641_22965 [Thermodesulfobacteriota bacterium]
MSKRICVIGAGPSGHVAALHALSLGAGAQAGYILRRQPET